MDYPQHSLAGPATTSPAHYRDAPATTPEDDSHSSAVGGASGPDNVVPIRPHVGYAAVAHVILASGLGTPLPLPRGRKSPPPDGWTGAVGPYASGADVQAWTESHPDGNTGLRFAPALVGIDVDAYDGKPGAQTMAALIEELGQLPRTVVVTSRGFAATGDPSGIRLYRLPQGVDQSDLQDVGPGVELIRAGHRYAVVAGTHPNTGGTYRWYDGGTAEELASLPTLDQIPELPPRWVEGLRRRRPQHEPSRAPDATEGPAYATMPEETRQRVDAYVSRIATQETAALAQLASWPEGHRDEYGRAWEKITADLANRLGRLERADWTPEGWGWSTLARIVPDVVARAVDLPEVWRRQRDRRDPAPFPTELAQSPVSIDQMAGGSAGATTPARTDTPLVGNVVSPASFLNGDGLRAQALLAQVMAQGPVATSPDGDVWTYAAGVWRPGEREVRRRISVCLGDRYRPAHAATILDLIRTQEPRITDRPQPRYLNFRNGMLDLHTGALAPHDPSLYSTNQLAVNWRPEATCPQIRAWLAQILPDPAEQRVWAELVGYAAYGDNPLHKAAILDGEGRNGKGTTLRIITALLGRENIAAVPPQKLDTDRWAAADLFGVLANLAGDVSPRSFTETETFKKATGGDLIRGERKHRDAFNFVSHAFLIGGFNRLPTSADHSEGFFSRWVLLPFRARIAEPDEQGNVPAGTIRKDPAVEQRLLTVSELEGLAVLAVGALRELLARGAFTETESGKAAQQEFRQHADPLRGFLAEAVSAAPTCHIPRSELYAAYERWCAMNHIKARGRNNFNDDLRTVHLEMFGTPPSEGPAGKGRKQAWLGLQLSPDHYSQAGGGGHG